MANERKQAKKLKELSEARKEKSAAKYAEKRTTKWVQDLTTSETVGSTKKVLKRRC